ncbi:MAG: hypothetical protein K0R13_3400 [Propionibacteriaceae bacterium]|nr:hypothetical protein [Propionibacteriaceae bacterium]
MTLIREIQELASDSTTSLPDLLRKTKILARRLQSPELADWADHELNGYPADAELPSYRVHKTYSRGRFADYGRRADLQIDTNALPERPDWREMATTVYFREPIAYFQELIATPRTADERFDWMR